MQKLLKLLFFACLIALSLGQFAKVGSIGAANIYIFDILVPFFALFGVIYFVFRHKSLKVGIPHFVFLMFGLVALLSLVVNIYALRTTEVLVSAFYLVRWLSYLLSGIVVLNLLQAKILSLETFLFSILFSGLFISLAGFFQLIVLPDFETLDPALGWDPHKYRLASTFFDPNFVAAYLGICLAIFVGLFFDGKRFLNNFKGFSFFQYIYFGIIPLLAMFLTFSRSGWGMFAVVILIFGIFRSRLMLILSITLAFLAYFAVPRVQTRLSGITDPADSAQFRLISWENSWEIAEDHLFLGVGFNAFRYAQRDYGFFETGDLGGNSGGGSDSSFLLVLATTGLIGFITFVAGYFWGAFNGFLKRKSGGLIVVSVLGGLFLSSQFVNSLFFPQIMFLWLSLISILEIKAKA